ncbi:ribonucleases P/MRP protein subunit POP1-domain-containing protein, partial [Melampsora americana]
SHQSKKLKLQNARQIKTQRPDQLLRSATIHAQSNLPEFLDVEKFINSRSFEISAMERAMKTARESGSQRAFQSLPRHLRRRAASHFSRRLPTRLRSKSKFEMLNDKKKSKSKSVKMKLRSKVFHQMNRTKVFQNRQVNKKWLTTHLWHSKRTKMIDIWGYRLAETPTEKSYRPTYRSSKHGSTIHDLSYFSHLTLSSEEESLIQLFNQILDPFGPNPSSIKYKAGHREINTNLYEFQNYPHGLIGPISIIWCPILNQSDENNEPPPAAQEVPKLNRSRFKFKSNFESSDDPNLINQIILPSDPITINTLPSLDLSSSLDHPPQQQHHHHSKEPSSISQETKDSILLENPFDSIPTIQRKVLIQIHPAIKDQVIETIHQAKRNLNVSCEVVEELGCLELFGPRASEVLGRVLETDEKIEVMKLFKNGVRPNLFPLGMVIGLTVDDPRVHFPPKRMKVVDEKVESIDDFKVIEPKAEIARSVDFWNDEIRLKKPKFKKSHIDKRREENIIPGERLKPMIEDDRIPILLIRIKLGWKLMMSTHWIQSFFHSILFTNSRLICLNQRSQIQFEHQMFRFPDDFTTLKAFEEIEEMKCRKEKKVWDRKPPSKRICFQTFESRENDYFFINWKSIFKNEEEEEEEEEGDEEENRYIPTDHLQPKVFKTPWLLNGQIIKTFLNSLEDLIKLNDRLNLNYEEIFEGSVKLFKKIIYEVNENRVNDLNLSLIGMKLIGLKSEKRLIGNERFSNQKMEKFCRIYEFDSKFINEKEGEKKNEVRERLKKELRLIGFLNFGNFSMRLGNCIGFGSCSFLKFIKIKLQNLLSDQEKEKDGFKMNEIKVFFRNRDDFEIKIGKLIVNIDE